jgi:CheY-like chemotaxis protein
VRADPSQLDQILLNLVVNARDAMPAGGTVTIGTGNVVFDEAYAEEHFDVAPGAYVMLAVSDTGYGMDRETRLHVFEPFFTTKGPGLGTGLGLSTIYGILRAAGGHIWLYSEPGRGTTFKLYFPRADAPVEELAPIRDAAAPTAGTVLLVEDDPTVRELTRRMLERGGYVVLAAADAREALGLLEAGGHLDALVTDVAMPDVSGAELARRTLALRPGLPVLLLSGYSAESAEIEALLREGVRFAGKPIASRDLLQLLGAALGQRSAHA